MIFAFYNTTIKEEIEEASYKIGDIKQTVRSNLGNNWLPCNGDFIDSVKYPELWNLQNVSLTGILDTKEMFNDSSLSGTLQNRDYVNFNGYFVMIDNLYNSSNTILDLRYTNDNGKTWGNTKLTIDRIPYLIYATASSNYIMVTFDYSESDSSEGISVKVVFINKQWNVSNVISTITGNTTLYGRSSLDNCFYVNGYFVAAIRYVGNSGTSSVWGNFFIIFNDGSTAYTVKQVSNMRSSEGQSNAGIYGIKYYNSKYYFCSKQLDTETLQTVCIYESNTINGDYSIIATINPGEIYGKNVYTRNIFCNTYDDTENFIVAYYDNSDNVGFISKFGIQTQNLTTILQTGYNSQLYSTDFLTTMFVFGNDIYLIPYNRESSSYKKAVIYQVKDNKLVKLAETSNTFNSWGSCMTNLFSAIITGSYTLTSYDQIKFGKYLPVIPADVNDNSYKGYIKAKNSDDT